MTAYELRRHLAAGHEVRLSGLDYDSLLAVHDGEHRGGTCQDHTHDEWTEECLALGCHDASGDHTDAS